MGDIVFLAPGVFLNADCILVEGSLVDIDEAKINGEKGTKQKSCIEDSYGKY